MGSYRAYLLDKDGRIHQPPKVIEANDDSEAAQAAQQLVDGHDVELWEGQRRIAKFTHENKRSRS